MIATFFKQRREEMNMTQDELAEKQELASLPSSVLKVQGLARIETFSYFCEALNLSPAAIPFDTSDKFIKAMQGTLGERSKRNKHVALALGLTLFFQKYKAESIKFAGVKFDT